MTSGDSILGTVRMMQMKRLILIVLRFNIQWPALPTILMGTVLIVMYVRLAREHRAQRGWG